MATQPFTWGFGGQAITSPEQAARKRAVAEALMGQSATPGQNWSEGLADVAAALSGTVLEGRVSEAEAAGRERAGSLFADLSMSQDPNAIIAALTSSDAAWASPAQTSIASALLQSGMERSDPMYQLQQQKLEQELAMMGQPAQPDYPTSVEEYLYAQQDPGFAAWQAENGGGQTINVGGESANIGTIPPGFAAVADPNSPAGYRFERIPGSDAEMEAAAAAAKAETGSGRRDLATETITTAANEARNVLNSGAVVSGTPGRFASILPESQAAELRRQTAVLTANATIENLTAMRQASPTGGALGSVTEKEGAMLAAASGALDPNASPEQYARALDNYEKTLLQIVHGPAEGERIFRETRPEANVAPAVIDWTEIDW